MTPDGAGDLLVVVECVSAAAEVVSDRLWSLGAWAIEERSTGDAVELRCSFGDDEAAVSDHLTDRLGDLGCRWRFESVDPSVADTWRSFVGVIAVDEHLSIRPAWLTPSAPIAPIELVIEPGSTFGLGNHATTRASLRMLRHALRAGDRVLDVGTGSGVLAIAAVRLGASHAHGVDITPASSNVVEYNAILNEVLGRVTVSTEPLSTLSAPGGAQRDLARDDGCFDVVVANILAPTLIELADDLVRLTGRVLVLSGLLDGAYAHVVDRMAPLRLSAIETVDGWVALSLVR